MSFGGVTISLTDLFALITGTIGILAGIFVDKWYWGEDDSVHTKRAPTLLGKTVSIVIGLVFIAVALRDIYQGR